MGTTYTLALSDAGILVTLNNASPIALTVPPNGTVNFPVPTMIDIEQRGVGVVTITAGVGVTLNSLSGTLITSGQYQCVSLVQEATNIWTLVGLTANGSSGSSGTVGSSGSSGTNGSSGSAGSAGSSGSSGTTGSSGSSGTVGSSGSSGTSGSAGSSGTNGATGSLSAWTEVTGTTQALAVNNSYIMNNAGLVTGTLPSTAAVGSVIEVTGKGTGGWKIAQNASGVIHFGNKDTTVGTGGSLASLNIRDTVRIVCVVANNEWNVLSSVGNMTII